MSVADEVGKRSLCVKAQVGAVIVDKTNRPVSTGYNGPPRNFDTPGDNRCDQWCSRAQEGDSGPTYGLSCPSVHAEANALMFADRRDYEGGTIYVTRSCCADCAKLIGNSGLLRVVMYVTKEDTHRNPNEVIRFLQDCRLSITVPMTLL